MLIIVILLIIIILIISDCFGDPSNRGKSKEYPLTVFLESPIRMLAQTIGCEATAPQNS